MHSYGLRVVLSFALAGGVLACGGPKEPTPLPPMPQQGEVVSLGDDPAREFDFWVGTWPVQNKHLGFTGRWKDTGVAVARIHSVAGGRAVLERWSGEAKGQLEGFSLRSWDPSLEKWQIALNWQGGQPAEFFLMHGERSGESIQLFPPGDRSSRYTFSEAREDSCQWDSAIPGANGWMTDWVMQFTRTSAAETRNGANAAVAQPPSRADDYPATRRLDELLGQWEGVAASADPNAESSPVAVRATVTSMLEGYGLLQFLDLGEQETVLAMAYEPAVERWKAFRADSHAQGLEEQIGSLEAGETCFEGPRTRECWRRLGAYAYEWKRELATGDGSWRAHSTADLQRRR